MCLASEPSNFCCKMKIGLVKRGKAINKLCEIRISKIVAAAATVVLKRVNNVFRIKLFTVDFGPNKYCLQFSWQQYWPVNFGPWELWLWVKHVISKIFQRNSLAQKSNIEINVVKTEIISPLFLESKKFDGHKSKLLTLLWNDPIH